MEILADMKDKADNQLRDLRNSEMKAKNSYELLRQGLQDEITAGKKELSDEKSAKAEAGEEKASSESDLAVANTEKSNGQQKNEQLASSCQTSAADHEANVAARNEELKVIDKAERILRESIGGSDSASFLQVSSRSTQ